VPDRNDPVRRRRLLALAGGTLAGGGLTGCLGSTGPGDASPSPTPTDVPDGSTTPDGSPTPDGSNAPTDDPPSVSDSLSEPDPDLPIVIENRHGRRHSVSVTVRRASGTVVHERTYEVAPDTDREVYNLRRAEPEGVETFTVDAAAAGQTATVSVETNACHGHVILALADDGEFYATYSIC
jgi:hypothetical protein